MTAEPDVPSPVEVSTPHGPARVTVHPPRSPGAAVGRSGSGVLVLGHGAGGGVGAPDLVAVTGTATAAGWAVALVEQPYRVAGRRAPAPAGQLDLAWLGVVRWLRETGWRGPAVFGGRSSGARVACRTAADGAAVAVLCLAFPLRPKGKPHLDRTPELAGVTVPVLVVQGERDPFGVPAPAPGREVVVLAGDHALRSDRSGLVAAVDRWLRDRAAVVSAPAPRR